MKITTISKLLEVINKAFPTKEYIKESIDTCEKVDNIKKGTKLDRYC